MGNKIIIRIANKYGNEVIYPANDSAETFTKLLRQKSLTRRDLELIKTLGFEIEIEPQTL